VCIEFCPESGRFADVPTLRSYSYWSSLPSSWGSPSYSESHCFSSTNRALAIQIRWKASDLSVLSTDPARKRNQSTTNGLSTGAKIGIGVGVPLVAIIVGILVFTLLHRRKPKPTSEMVEKEDPTNDMGNDAPEVDTRAANDRKVAEYAAPALDIPVEKRQVKIDEAMTTPVNLGLPFNSAPSTTSIQTETVPVNLGLPFNSSPPTASIQTDPPWKGSQTDLHPVTTPESGLEVVYELQEGNVRAPETRIGAVPQSSDVTNAERATLMEELKRLEERKQRLLMVNAVEDQEEHVRKRISQLNLMSGQVSSRP
jgi:hypothetical protein